MKNIISLFIILFILYFIYNNIYYDNIENFSNDPNQYLAELHDLIKNGKMPDTTVNGNLNVTGNTTLNGGINSNLNITGSIVSNGDLTGNILRTDKIILGNKYVLYTKNDAFVIGKLVNNNIAPALYLNPGSREGTWLVENNSNGKIYYYWWNSGSSGHASRNYNDLNGILTNTNYRSFDPIDSI
jgi:hypothetical protein